MSSDKAATRLVVVYRFGSYELDTARNEVRKLGLRVRLERKPLQLLIALVERPGEVITRSDLKRLLWGEDLFVDFENGLNVAARKVRATLNDSPETPTYIETVAGEGYRFIAPVERVNGSVETRLGVQQEPSAHLAMPWRLLALGGVSAVILIGAIGMWRLDRARKKALNFGARDWVLISSFENRTRQPSLDGVLEYALHRELSNSRFVSVVPRERTEDVLRLMRKPFNTTVDTALGKEICLRDGGIRALLTGRVEKVGTTYVLSAEIVDPATGVAVASISEEDPSDSQMAGAVRRLSNRVRETLGEQAALIQQSDKRLERVTTPSLYALQLYSQADQLMRSDFDGSNQAAAAAELLKRAMAEDPGFASGHLLLAYAYENLGMAGEARSEFQRALDLVGTTTDREGFFIRASYYDYVERDERKAITAYKALLGVYPDHYWAANNLVGLYLHPQRIDELAPFLVWLADMRPSDLTVVEMAAWAKAIIFQDWSGAQSYLNRASALVAAQGQSTDPWLELLPAYRLWLQGSITEAHEEVLRIEGKTNGADDGYLVPFFLTFGELEKAERHVRGAPPDTPNREQDMALISFLRGDQAAAKRHLQHGGHHPLGSAALLLPRLGLFADASGVIDWVGASALGVVMKGEIALVRGETDQAVALLDGGLDWGPRSIANSAFFFGSEALAEAYRRQGRFDDALRVLLNVATKKEQTYGNPAFGSGTTAWNWMRLQLQLADLYRKRGSVAQAEQIEGELRKMLVYADANFPLLVELQKRQQLSAATLH